MSDQIFPDSDKNFISDEDLMKLKLFPILIRPSLGQPEFINASNFNFEDSDINSIPEILEFEFEGLFTCSRRSKIDELAEEIDKRIWVYPLGEEIIDGKAVRMEKLDIIVKEFKPIQILPIDNIEFEGHPQKYLETEKIFPGRDQYMFLKCHFSASSNIFISKSDNQNILNGSKYRDEILCDIVYDLSEEITIDTEAVDPNYLDFMGEKKFAQSRINYHALVLTLKNKYESSDIKFWHVTDLHIAKQNDRIPSVVLKKIKNKNLRDKDEEKIQSLKSEFENYLFKSYIADEDLKNIRKRIENRNCIVHPITEDFKYSQEENFWDLPIEYRIQNFNNNLRMLIYQANDAYLKNELDFIAITGDFTDYVTPRWTKNYEYKNTNWKVVMDILLGKPHKKDEKTGEILPGLLKPEEILIPIFCIPGNHDYIGHDITPNFYPANYGLHPNEMDLFPSSGVISNIQSLISNVKYLKGYFQFFNPDLNFAKKFGQTHLIFMDTDKNSLVDLMDMIKGSPSTKGFRDNQFTWLRNYCNLNVKDDDTIILLTHAPPLNPPKLDIIRNSIEKIYPNLKKEEKELGTKKITIDLLQEYNLIEKFDDPRIDPIINLKFGTILNNWEEMLEFLLNCRQHGISKKVNLVLSGHAHKNLEFRLENLQGRDLSKTSYVDHYPFYKINIPGAIYMGEYSKEYEGQIKYIESLEHGEKLRKLADRNLIVNKFPFIVQTTSLGPRSRREHSKIQGYRKIFIHNNRIESFNFTPILKYLVPFETFTE